MKKSNVNIPEPPAGSRKNAKTPVETGNTGPQNPGEFPAEPPASRPNHATRFRPGISGNPKGRPTGALNKSTLDARALLAANARKLTDHAIEMALKGSPTALRLCLERVHPAMKDRPVQLNFPRPQDDRARPPRCPQRPPRLGRRRHPHPLEAEAG